jgi:hypothetical protein
LLLFFAKAVLDWLSVSSRGFGAVGAEALGLLAISGGLGLLVAAGDFWRTWVAGWWLPAISGGLGLLFGACRRFLEDLGCGLVATGDCWVGCWLRRLGLVFFWLIAWIAVWLVAAKRR